MHAQNTRNKVIVHILLIFFGLIMLFPFLWMILTSLKTYRESILVPPIVFPTQPTTEAYEKVFSLVPFATLYKNTIMSTFMITFGQMAISACAAYAFARIRFPGRNVIFFLILSVLMVPGQVYILPQYLIMQNMGLLNTITALWLPNIFTAYGTFLLRQFFMSLPVEIEEAALIDGCNRYRTFWSISLPLARSGFVSFGIIAMLFGWNDLLWPTIVTSSQEKMTLPLGLNLLQGQYVIEYPVIMAGSLLATLPLIVVFLIFQKQFIEGIALTGTKA